MNRLRNKLLLAFLAVTLLPLTATLWMTTQLLQQSLNFSSIRELDGVSKSLENAGREYYQSARESLKQSADAGRIEPTVAPHGRLSDTQQEFWDSGDHERFVLTGKRGENLEYLVRQNDAVAVYAMHLDIGMTDLSRQYRSARQVVQQSRQYDLRRGFTYTYLVLTLAIWFSSLAVLIYLANRISNPIQKLTLGLARLSDGDFNVRILNDRDDEVGRATQAFNHTAAHLQQSRDRLVYLTQLASWQVLARKMAHEVKNSLTPIRLTVEEMVARHSEPSRAFLEQAAQIVVDEVESLERRVRAFSELSAEPPVRPTPLDVNAIVEERIQFLGSSHPEVSYAVRLAQNTPSALADEDLVKSILVNLLENAAEACGSGGHVLASTALHEGKITIEVHDSGPGLSDQARKSLFQPTISFKRRGMGLGLSIARKGALLNGGDLLLVDSELGGAGFRLTLPVSRTC